MKILKMILSFIIVIGVLAFWVHVRATNMYMGGFILLSDYWPYVIISVIADIFAFYLAWVASSRK